MLVKQTQNMGLKSLLLSSGYKNIDSNTISFGVAPRINACGRMGHADEALKLFLAKDIYEVNRLTQLLNDYNKIRQEKEKSIYEEAIKQIEEKQLFNKNAIIVTKPGIPKSPTKTIENIFMGIIKFKGNDIRL